jgi:hypothetical protein
MADAPLTQILLSAAAGALIATSLNYFAQTRLALRNKKIEEKRISYIYFAKSLKLVSDIELVIKIFKPYADIIKKEIQEKENKNFRPSHFIVASVFYMLHSRDDEDKNIIDKLM